MLRILAGEKKGHNLKVPHTKAVRPTAANARQVLFDILGDVTGTRWLDLYAGSGAVGLEALSRGASHCVLVESARACLAAIRDNIEILGYEDRAKLIEGPVDKALKWLANEVREFDILFLDPPYYGKEATQALLALGEPAAAPLFAGDDALVIAQITTHTEIRPRYGALELQRERKMGDTRLCFFRRKMDEQPQPGGMGEQA